MRIVYQGSHFWSKKFKIIVTSGLTVFFQRFCSEYAKVSTFCKQCRFNMENNWAHAMAFRIIFKLRGCDFNLRMKVVFRVPVIGKETKFHLETLYEVQ